MDDKSSVDLAVERGDTGALAELLAAGPPSDTLHDGLQSALEIAAQGGHARVGARWFGVVLQKVKEELFLVEPVGSDPKLWRATASLVGLIV